MKHEPNWGPLDPSSEQYNKTVANVVNHAVRRVGFKYRDFVDSEDLLQEARLMVALRADHQFAIQKQDYGVLQYQLECDLDDHCRMAFSAPRNYDRRSAEVKSGERLAGEVIRPLHSAIARRGVVREDEYGNVTHEHADLSFDKLAGESEEGSTTSSRKGYVAINSMSNDYTRESVESLLPAVWDESYLYGLPVHDRAPDPDMPKGTVNKARGNNIAVYIADVKVGWERALLTHQERAAVFLYYGPLAWKQSEIAYNQGVDRWTVSRRVESAIGKIVARMNGGYWYGLEESA